MAPSAPRRAPKPPSPRARRRKPPTESLSSGIRIVQVENHRDVEIKFAAAQTGRDRHRRLAFLQHVQRLVIQDVMAAARFNRGAGDHAVGADHYVHFHLTPVSYTHLTLPTNREV